MSNGEEGGQAMSEAPGDPFELVRDGDADALARVLAATPELASSVDAHGTPLLHVAAETDDPRLVTLVLDAGADADMLAPWGQTAFEWAANMGAGDTAALLLERGHARLDLWTAAALGMSDTMESFVRDGTVPSGSGRSPSPDADLSGWPRDTPYRSGDEVSDAFYIACRNGHLDVAARLHDLGAKVDATGYFGATALQWAALNGHGAVVDFLVDSGADVRRKDPKFDATAAGWAREGGHAELAARLEALE